MYSTSANIRGDVCTGMDRHYLGTLRSLSDLWIRNDRVKIECDRCEYEQHRDSYLHAAGAALLSRHTYLRDIEVVERHALLINLLHAANQFAQTLGFLRQVEIEDWAAPGADVRLR